MKMAARVGFEPTHDLINSQALYQFGYLAITWWACGESNSAFAIKSRALRRQSFKPGNGAADGYRTHYHSFERRGARPVALCGELVSMAGIEPALSD